MKNLNQIDFNDIDMTSIEVDGINRNDYPDFCDAYITYACFNNGKELTDSELDQLMDDDGAIEYTGDYARENY